MELDSLRGPSSRADLVALGDHLDDVLTTPFEDWCEATGTHPESFGAWESFTRQARVS